MDQPRDSVADALADAILRGEPVDWPDVEAASDGGLDPDLIDQLKVLSSVVAAYRQLSRAPERPVEKDIIAGSLQSSAESTVSSEDACEGRTFGPLRIIAKIGEGSFGEVYRAWDTRLEREVALKLLRTDTDEDPQGTLATLGNPSAILSEARQLARVRHPHVVTVYGADYLDGRVGLWMELVEGETLYTFVRGAHPLPVDQLRSGCRDLSAALAAVHASGLIHGDITPKNIMRETTGRVVLMDFGAGHDQKDAACSHQYAGTPVCMAPEVIAGGAPTAASDLYSLGITLYFAATGTFPISGRSMREIRDAHARETLVPVLAARPDLPHRLSGIIDSMRSVDPARRPRADQLHAALALETAEDAGSRPPDEAPTSHSSRSPRIVGALASVLLVTLLAWFGATRAEDAAAAGDIAAPPRDPHGQVLDRLVPGHLLFPVASLNAIQQVDPVTRSIVRTLRLPDGYYYREPSMQYTVLVRNTDRAILTNARDATGRPVLLVLSEHGERTSAHVVPSSFPIARQYLQQIHFDVNDPTQSRVLGGVPFTPSVFALNPLTGAITTRLTEPHANYIGLQADPRGRVYVANWTTGQVTRYVASAGSDQLIRESVFADVSRDTGASGLNALAIDDEIVYVAQCDSQRVLKYVGNPVGVAVTGTLVAKLTDPDMTYPCSVSVEPSTGRAYISNLDSNVVVIFERDGSRAGSFKLGGSHVGIAAVVPSW
jgi:serine/threonine-protein kinase